MAINKFMYMDITDIRTETKHNISFVLTYTIISKYVFHHVTYDEILV